MDGTRIRDQWFNDIRASGRDFVRMSERKDSRSENGARRSGQDVCDIRRRLDLAYRSEVMVLEDGSGGSSRPGSPHT